MKVSIQCWSVRTRNSLPPSSSRSFGTQSHWSFTTGQCVYSEQFHRVLFYHIGCAVSLHSITNSGLIAGGQHSSRDRQTVFFTAVNPTQKDRGKPDMKVNFLWALELSSIIERDDPSWTLSHQATQNGMLIKFGLLKSGNLMNWLKIEQGDLLYSHSTRIDFLLMTIRCVLTPSQKSEMSLKSRSFLNRLNDQVRRRQKRSSMNVTKDSDKHSLIWEFYVFYITSICIHEEELLWQFAFHQK